MRKIHCELCRVNIAEYTIDFLNAQNKVDGILTCVLCTNRFKDNEQKDSIVIPIEYIPHTLQDYEQRCYVCGTKINVHLVDNKLYSLCVHHSSYHVPDNI